MIKLTEKKYPYLPDSIYQAKLENGLSVILIPKKEFHETYVAMTVYFGSVDNMLTTEEGVVTSYPAGIAHFLEHKLFEMSDGGDFLQEFTKYGVEANAYTGFSQTSYFFSTTDVLHEPLNLLQEMLQEAHFTKESVEKEKDIIAQEIDMYADDPDHRLYLGILKGLYPDTALSEDIAGTVSSIRDISVEMLQEHFQYFYQPSQMTLVVMGDIVPQEVFQWIVDKQNSLYGKSSAKARLSRNHVEKKAIKEHGKESWEVALPKLAIGFRGNDVIPVKKEQYYRTCLSILLSMFIGRTSKRYQTLYEAGKIDSSFHFHIEVHHCYHFVVMTVDTKEPIALSSQLQKALLFFEEDDDISEEHFQIVKKELYGDYIRGLNSLEQTVEQFVSYHSDTESIFEFPSLLAELTLEEVISVGRIFMASCDRTDFMIFPK